MLLLELLLDLIKIDVGLAFHKGQEKLYANSNYTQRQMKLYLNFLCIHNLAPFLSSPRHSSRDFTCGSPQLENALNCAP